MSTGIIFKKLIAILNEVEAVAKNKTNSQQGYKFRGIDDMYNALHPLFSKHGVIIGSEVVGSQREERQTKNGGNLNYSIIDVKFTFYAEDGSSVSSTIKGEAMDSADKATNKAISAALKYALMQMFLIPTEDIPDADKDTPEPLSKEASEKEKIKHEYVQILKTSADVFPTIDQAKYAFKDTWSLDGAKTAISKLMALKLEREQILAAEAK